LKHKVIKALLGLITLAAWVLPLHAASSQTQTKTEYKNQDYVSEDIIIKDNAIQHTSPVVDTTQHIFSKTTLGKNVTRTTSGTGIYNGRNYSKEEVEQLIRDYSAQFGISADLPFRIAYCESGYNALSANRSSSARGVYQYLSGTWANTSAGRQGTSVFDADANVHMAVSSIATHGTAPWLASKNCWSNN